MAGFQQELSNVDAFRTEARGGGLANALTAGAAGVINVVDTINEVKSIDKIRELGADLSTVEQQAVTGRQLLQELINDLGDDTSINNVKRVFNDFQRLSNGQIQGAIRPSEAKARASIIFRQAIVGTPSLSSEFERMFFAFGFSGTSGGVGSAGERELSAQLESFEKLVQQSISSGVPIERIIEDNALTVEADRSSNLITIAANQGKLSHPFLMDGTGKRAESTLTNLTNQFMSDVKSPDFNIEDFRTGVLAEFNILSRDLDSQITEAAKNNQLFSIEQVNAARGLIENQQKIMIDIMDTSDPLAVVTRLVKLKENLSEKSVQDFFSGFGQFGNFFINMSPDARTSYMLGALSFKEKMARVGPSAIGAFDELGSIDPKIAAMLGLVRAGKGSELLLSLLTQMENPDPDPNKDNNPDQATKIIQEEAYAETHRQTILEGSVSDERLKTLSTNVANIGSTFRVSSILLEPHIIEAIASKPAILKRTIQSILTKTKILTNEVLINRENPILLFDETLEQPFKIRSDDTTRSGGPFGVSLATPSALAKSRQADSDHGVTKQLSNFYKFLLKTKGIEDANSFADNLLEQFNKKDGE